MIRLRIESRRMELTLSIFSIGECHVVREQGKVSTFFLFILEGVSGRLILRILWRRGDIGTGRISPTEIGRGDRRSISAGREGLGLACRRGTQLPLLLKQRCLNLRSGFSLGLLNVLLKISDLLRVNRN